jgi:DNA-binding PadR family transcriptional regulator
MKLTDTQHKLLEAAAKHPQKRLTDFPATLKGGALIKVLTALCNAGLITSNNKTREGTAEFVITTEGLKALGIPLALPTQHREGTKQARLIELLKRPEGASLAEMKEATGWQQHTLRGAMAGALKKKLGLNIVSEKTIDQERKYRIT